MRVEAHQGDRRQKASEVNRTIERSEVSFPADPFRFGQSYSVSFDMLFEGRTPSTAKNDKFFQIHNVNDPGDSSLGPVFAMQLEGDRMRMVVRSDAAAATTSRVEDKWVFEDTKNIERDHWYKFVVNIKVDPFGKGQLQVTRDGVEVASFAGAIGYNDEKPPYAKIGIYRDTQPEPQARRYSNFSINDLS